MGDKTLGPRPRNCTLTWFSVFSMLGEVPLRNHYSKDISVLVQLIRTRGVIARMVGERPQSWRLLSIKYLSTSSTTVFVHQLSIKYLSTSCGSSVVFVHWLQFKSVSADKIFFHLKNVPSFPSLLFNFSAGQTPFCSKILKRKPRIRTIYFV